MNRPSFEQSLHHALANLDRAIRPSVYVNVKGLAVTYPQLEESFRLFFAFDGSLALVRADFNIPHKPTEVRRSAAARSATQTTLLPALLDSTYASSPAFGHAWCRNSRIYCRGIGATAHDAPTFVLMLKAKIQYTVPDVPELETLEFPDWGTEEPLSPEEIAHRDELLADVQPPNN